MKGLPALIRLHNWRLDEKRRELAELGRFEDHLLGEIRRLEGEVSAEQDFAQNNDSGGLSFGGFAIGVIERRRKIEASVAEARRRIEAKREELANAFRDLKRYEITLAARQKRELRETDRRTQADLDEISMIQHQRKVAGAA